MQNPFTLTFGKSPLVPIERPAQVNEVIESFTAEPANQQMFVLTGIRGAGKTVMLTEISRKIDAIGDWIVIELNPSSDLLESLLAKLSSHRVCAGIIKAAKIDLSFFGIGMSIEGSLAISDAETAIIAILEKLKSKGKKLLITIDEITNNKYMRVFAGSFQIFIRRDLPVYLLFAGLYENIEDLQNENNLTFLYRAPKIPLKPLNMQAVARKYQNVLDISPKDAEQMAELTLGYPFAFQVLGYLTWNNGGNFQAVLGDYEQYLSEFVYDKLWSELSAKDRIVAGGIAGADSEKVKDVRAKLDMEAGEFSPYRQRLIKKGILSSKARGYVTFTLPLFREYVINHL